MAGSGGSGTAGSSRHGSRVRPCQVNAGEGRAGSLEPFSRSGKVFGVAVEASLVKAWIGW